MSRIDDYQKLLEKVEALKEENMFLRAEKKKLSERLETQRQKAYEAMDELKTVMAGLMIDRPCVTCKGTGINPNFGGSCVVCEGSGKVSRTARANDVREFIEQTLKHFPLKDGAVLRVDFPYV